MTEYTEEQQHKLYALCLFLLSIHLFILATIIHLYCEAELVTLNLLPCFNQFCLRQNRFPCIRYGVVVEFLIELYVLQLVMLGLYNNSLFLLIAIVWMSLCKEGFNDALHDFKWERIHNLEQDTCVNKKRWQPCLRLIFSDWAFKFCWPISCKESLAGSVLV